MLHALQTVLPSLACRESSPTYRTQLVQGDHERDEVVWSVVVAGGSGARFGAPKQFEMLGGERVVDRSAPTARR
jgi:hypothetical protein